MLDIQGRRVSRHCRGQSRRDFLRVGAAGAAGAEPHRLAADAGLRTGPAGQGQVGDPDLAEWRPSHLDTFDPKPEAGAGLLRPAEDAAGDQCPGHPDRRADADDGQAGGQVLHHPQLHASRFRPRDGAPTRSSPAPSRRPTWSIRRWAAVVALEEGLRSGLPGKPAAVHHADVSAGPVLGFRIPGQQVQDLCHVWRPERRGLPRAGHDAARRRDRRARAGAPQLAAVGGRLRQSRGEGRPAARHGDIRGEGLRRDPGRSAESV